MPVCETFASIQGEQQGLGVPCFFVRVFGCNLGPDCPVDCDTPYSWKRDETAAPASLLPPGELARDMLASNKRAVVVTGGEPMLHQQAIVELVDVVERDAPGKVTWYIETNGTIPPGAPLARNARVLFNVSPKLDTFSHEPFPLERSIFKHVVDPSTVAAITARLDALPASVRSRACLMPRSRNRDEYLASAPAIAAWCIEHDLAFGPRLHLVLWDGRRGT